MKDTRTDRIESPNEVKNAESEESRKIEMGSVKCLKE